MSELPESVVRNFLASWIRSDVNEMTSFFHEDAVYIDGPKAPIYGLEAITTALGRTATLVPGIAVDIKVLLTGEGTVVVERVDTYSVADKSFHLEVAAVFNVDEQGLLTRWRDYYDLYSVEGQLPPSLRAGE